MSIAQAKNVNGKELRELVSPDFKGISPRSRQWQEKYKSEQEPQKGGMPNSNQSHKTQERKDLGEEVAHCKRNEAKAPCIVNMQELMKKHLQGIEIALLERVSGPVDCAIQRGDVSRKFPIEKHHKAKELHQL